MSRIISLADALKLEDPLYIDMRSPSEYQQGCIPGAINLPLLDDEERGEVGTTYRTVGPDQAKQQGLSIVSGKLPDLVSQIREYHKTGRTVVVYCWRGGMRSKSVVSVLDLMGISAYQLVGGYKAFRTHVLESLTSFPLRPAIVVLSGSTGVGKTTMLKKLMQAGVPVIDLEALANHRGSVFGQVGLGRPQTAQNFDALLLSELSGLNNQPYIIVECESKRIGNVYLPEVLYQAMQKGKKILAQASVETRVSRLIEEYMDIYNHRQEEILGSIAQLAKRLGNTRTNKMLEDFTAGRVRDVVRTLLVDYYDPLYGYEKADPSGFDRIVDAEDMDKASSEIIDYLNTLRG